MKLPTPRTATPKRVQITKVDGRVIIPDGAIRVDKVSRWWPPFDLDHPYLKKRWSVYVDDRAHKQWLHALMYRHWITGELVNNSNWWLLMPDEIKAALPAPIGVSEIRHILHGRDIADWAPLGAPCIGDVLLSLANSVDGAAPYPTPSDGFRPMSRKQSPGEAKDARRRYSFWGI